MGVLERCGYGEVDGPDCCLVEGGRVRCPVYDAEPCPFGRKVEGCGTCAHLSGMTLDGDARMVACSENAMQMHAPYACECVHWERALG